MAADTGETSIDWLGKYAQIMYDLYRGNDRSYGQFNPKTLKGFTKSLPVSVNDFKAHITGTMGVGVVPIMDDGNCWWGAIDIDNHGVGTDGKDIPIGPIDEIVLSKKLPLVLCRSKSGGIHAYAFFDKPTKAIDVRNALKKMARALGYPNAEIFPKQNSLKSGQITGSMQMGNWINLPYMGGNDTARYAYRSGNKLELYDFLTLADKLKIQQKYLDDFALFEHEDAPPCIQAMILNGVDKGGRNEAIFHIGVYLAKAYPEEVEARLKEINAAIFNSPLPQSELKRTINSCQRPDYRYRCGIDPQHSLCQRAVCLTRKYGITDSSNEVSSSNPGIPIMSDLVKYLSDPIRWSIRVGGREVTNLATAQIMEWRFMREAIMEKLDMIAPMVKPVEWERMLGDCMQGLRVVEAPEDASISGLIRSKLREFASKTDLSSKGNEVDDRKVLIRGLPCVQLIDGEPCVLFRQPDFVNYLKRTRSEELRGINLWFAVKSIGVQHKTIRIADKVINIWYLPVSEVSSDSPDIEPPQFKTEL